ncbi:cilia- and flagella-associated protein 61 isoform X2 [Syngnathoides biaculeatus]|uniref:cilia- and flagella-associated protein 61 isoform X2 n=1 Tax=Syngnathoides biaculeatus TaxID=300417 RepID=UPI002ADE22CC|nr:cilia- and flagella-associated protein 61 isoform X2 [Syngnathoides biaculeatus]
MKNTMMSSSGRMEKVTVRRSECADAEAIEGLITPEVRQLFGPVNVLRLLEKANLAVSLANEDGDVVAQASFFDHPAAALVDPPHWESFLRKHFKADALTPWNTLFLHLFVSQTCFSASSFQHIISAVFNTTAELDYVCLLCSTPFCLEAALDELLEPLQRLTEEEEAAELNLLLCNRQRLCPRLFVRPARVEDHDDVMHIVAQHTKILSVMRRPYFLSELIEAQDEHHHAAVCECDGVITGFISVTAEVDVRQLQEHFNLTQFGGLRKTRPDDGNDTDPHADSADEPPEEPPQEPPQEPLEEQDQEEEEEEELQEGDKEVLSATFEETSAEPNTFCIQFFFSEKNYEIRSLDLIPYIFQLFPDLDFCIITVPTLSPDFPLLQNFLRVPPRPSSLLPSDLYVLHCDALRRIKVRPAVESDRDAVAGLMADIRLEGDAVLQDLDLIFNTQSDGAECPLQAFLADVDGAIVGTLIISDEKDMEYIRARFNIENFIYFSHHGAHEHAQLRHFVLRHRFQHFSRHFFKETLRLARKSNLYHRVYPLDSGQESSCVHHLDFVLDCAVPVRPRRQIIYPLRELGANAPARSITDEQAPFALNLISRKLTMEPKLTVNARIVLVGASDTGLSFLEVLCFCPHLRFNNLTLISTHGFPADCSLTGAEFLSTSHAYSSRDMAQLPLRSCVTEVAAKMVAIQRKSKHVVVSSGAKIPYDYLVLCTGLQYQVPCPKEVTQDQLKTNDQHEVPSFPPRYTGTVPSNFFTLNDPHDCNAARSWLLKNFVRRKDNVIVYGNGLDVFTTVEMLLRIGVRGSCIHLVLTPPQRTLADDLSPVSDVTNDPLVEGDVTRDPPREIDVPNELTSESDVTKEPPPETNDPTTGRDVTDDLPREVDNTKASPSEIYDTNDLPPEIDETNDSRHEGEITDESPRESDATIDLPLEDDATNNSPHESDVTNDQLPENEVTDDSPPENDITNDSPPASDVTDTPLEIDITNDLPSESDTINDAPPDIDDIDDLPRESDITIDLSPENDTTSDPPPENDVTNDAPPESDVTSDLEIDGINESPREVGDANNSPPDDIANDSPPEIDVSNDVPPESDVTSDLEIDDNNESPRDIDDTNNSPADDVTNDSPPEIDDMDDSPPEIDVTDDLPHEVDDTKDSPSQVDDTDDRSPEIDDTDPLPCEESEVRSESPPKSDVTNESPPQIDVTNNSPPEIDTSNDSPPQIDLTNNPVPENGTSTDPLPKRSLTNEPTSTTRVVKDPLPESLFADLSPTEPSGLYFFDAGVESAVIAAMKKAQIQVHHDCLLTQMNNGEHPDPLTSVSFSTASEPLHLPCGVFINLSSRGVDYDAFRSINSSFLVFDGRLVIDSAFRTNDTAIWGAGPLTKFSRSYYSDEWSHANFNSKEVGQDLAAVLLRHFDPTLEAPSEASAARNRLVPIYKQPKIQGGKLPGRLNYLHVTKPVASSPRGTFAGHARRVATGCPENGDYFCLHLDHNQVVETITCLSVKPLPVHNLMCLYAKHQQLLGQLLVRLYLKQIQDLYSFFRQSWCLAIFHDRFSDFEEEILQMTSKDAEFDKGGPQGTAPRDVIKDPATRAALRINSAKYLSFNRNLLPMFTCPDSL